MYSLKQGDAEGSPFGSVVRQRVMQMDLDLGRGAGHVHLHHPNHGEEAGDIALLELVLRLIMMKCVLTPPGPPWGWSLG